jgi:hypothetical protein
MPSSEKTTHLFVGDLADPWVSAIASSIPRPRCDLQCVGELPAQWPDDALSARVVVIHRPTLSQHDVERIEAIRDCEGPPPRVILCAGPNVRYHQLERCSALVDILLADATASEVIARHGFDLPARFRPDVPRSSVAIRSMNPDLRAMLSETCRSAGFAIHDGDATASPAGTLVVWDVPILEDGWEMELRLLANQRRVVTLIGFPDRSVVSQARQAGAFAAIELPCDPLDLIFVLDRAAAMPPDCAVPPGPLGFKFARTESSVAGRAGESYNRNGD